MTAQYRIVHFVPQPFLGAKIPVAALVRHGGATRVVAADRQLDADSVGGVAQAATLRMLLRALEGASFDDLPATAGPHAVLDEPRAIPDSVDPLAWVSAFVLPARERGTRRTQRPRWSQYGLEFFRRHDVERHVQKRYSPQRYPDVVPELRGARLQPISQWVKGREAMLLMEPIVPADTRLDQALQDIATTFSAYRFHLPQHVAAFLIVYVLPGAPERLRARVREELEASAHQVVELDLDNERDLFVRRIQTVGEASNGLLRH